MYSQYLTGVEAATFEDTPFSPEQILCLEVIHRALHDIRTYFEDPNSLQKLVFARGAKKWILQNKTTPFSFIWCCDVCYEESEFLVSFIRKEASVELPTLAKLRRSTDSIFTIG